jgi:uncharacterized protein (UPF0210 family)
LSLLQKVRAPWEGLLRIKKAYEDIGYQVQTLRISFNSFEEWLLPRLKGGDQDKIVVSIMKQLENLLEQLDVPISSIGPCTDIQNASIIPSLLSLCPRVSSSVLFGYNGSDVAPNYEDCLQAAQVCLKISEIVGDLGNFRFCVGFHCPSNTPFYPVSHHRGSRPCLTVGLENGDLVFLSFFGANDHQTASENLRNAMKQVLLPIQRIAVEQCRAELIDFGGIDASVNPGLALPDSVGQGLEQFLSGINAASFGGHGTLSAVSAVTAALKALEKDAELRLAGYCGLMLPVMEDLVLAARAAEQPPRFSLRDLLVFSTICGVGLDTVPVPGASSAEEIAAVYLDLGTLAFRLRKPLTARLLPMADKAAGDLTSVDSPFLCNTRVFSLR